jgi:hypothetical protein
MCKAGGVELWRPEEGEAEADEGQAEACATARISFGGVARYPYCVMGRTVG